MWNDLKKTPHRIPQSRIKVCWYHNILYTPITSLLYKQALVNVPAISGRTLRSDTEASGVILTSQIQVQPISTT